MLAPVLVSYFLHQFQPPVAPLRSSTTPATYQQLTRPQGDITVETASHPVASVPRGAQGVEMLRLNVSATCQADVMIENLRVQRRGLGANEDIDLLYVVHRGQRVSSARPISRKDGSVDFSLRRFMVPACGLETISVLADFSASASVTGQHRLELSGVDTSNATVRVQRLPGVLQTQTAAQRSGVISAQMLSLNRRVRFGSRQLVARFLLEADNQTDHRIHSIQFTNRGSASDADLQNLYVEFRDRSVSQRLPRMNGDTAVLLFDPPLLLRRNQSLKFGLRADVRASRSRTLQFIIEQPSDISATPFTERN